jgi:hypothetical protein
MNALEYPVSAEQLRLHPEMASRLRVEFSVRWKYVRFDTPDNLCDVDPGLYRREAEKAVAEWQEIRESVGAILRREMSDLVSGMMQKLADDGKRKVIRKTFLPKITDWLKTFNDRNIVDDARLRTLADEMRQLLEGVDKETLASDTQMRASMRAGFQSIQTTLTTMLVDRPTRAISFVDE